MPKMVGSSRKNANQTIGPAKGNSTLSYKKKEAKEAVNRTLPVNGGKRKKEDPNATLDQTIADKSIVILDHMKLAELIGRKKQPMFRSAVLNIDRKATKHSKYYYLVNWKDDKVMSWVPEQDVPSESALNAYKKIHDMPNRHEVSYRRLALSDDEVDTDAEESIVTRSGGRLNKKTYDRSKGKKVSSAIRRQPMRPEENDENDDVTPPTEDEETNAQPKRKETFVCPLFPAPKSKHVLNCIGNNSNINKKNKKEFPGDASVFEVPADPTSVRAPPLRSTIRSAIVDPVADVQGDAVRKINNKRRYPFSDYKFISRIGTGAQAFVYRAINVRTEEEVAIKLFKKDCNRANILDEIVLLESTNHENVLRMVDQYTWRDDMLLVTELAQGSLYEEIVAANGSSLPAERVAQMARGVLSALAFLHAKFGFHRDVKPENILKVGDTYKLADFGIFVHGVDEKPVSKVGTSVYMAPEVNGKNEYDAKVDVYGLGVVVAEALIGRCMQTDEDFSVFCAGASTQLMDFVAVLTESDPAFRPTAQAALTHPFVTRKGRVDGWKVGKIKLQRNFKIKDSTVLYEVQDEVGVVRERLNRLWEPRVGKEMKLTVAVRNLKENRVRDGRLCKDYEKFFIVATEFNAKVVYQRVSPVNDGDADKVCDLSVRFNSWGTIPKMVSVGFGSKIRSVIETLLRDLELPSPIVDDYDLIVNRRKDDKWCTTTLGHHLTCKITDITDQYFKLVRKGDNDTTSLAH